MISPFDVMRKQLEKMYFGKCDVYEYVKIKNEQTKITSHKEKLVYSNIPCRLSYGKSPANTINDGAELAQTIKLFMAPDIVINAGSKIVVTQNNRTEAYSNSGKSKVYNSHQEIELEIFKEWS